MSALFVHPPLQSAVSGGNVFNRHIIQQALENNYLLRSFPVDKPEAIDRLDHEITRTKAGLLIWDSLFFDLVSKFHGAGAEIDTALLVHYLPSLNPACKRSLKKELERQENEAIRNCTKAVCTGSTTFRTISERFPEKPLFLCEPGVDACFRPPPLALSAPGDNEPVELISVANLHPEKGYLDLLKVLSDLKTYSWNWHIVGSEDVNSSFTNEFRSSALAAGLTRRIHWHGILDQQRLATLLSEMDLFVSASYYESYGMAIAEAVATGLPVVSTRTGAAPELIDHDRSGFVVPIGDLQSMKFALEELMLNPTLRQAFRLEARSKLRRSWINCFENFQNACDSF